MYTQLQKVLSRKLDTWYRPFQETLLNFAWNENLDDEIMVHPRKVGIRKMGLRGCFNTHVRHAKRMDRT